MVSYGKSSTVCIARSSGSVYLDSGNTKRGVLAAPLHTQDLRAGRLQKHREWESNRYNLERLRRSRFRAIASPVPLLDKRPPLIRTGTHQGMCNLSLKCCNAEVPRKGNPICRFEKGAINYDSLREVPPIPRVSEPILHSPRGVEGATSQDERGNFTAIVLAISKVLKSHQFFDSFI